MRTLRSLPCFLLLACGAVAASGCESQPPAETTPVEKIFTMATDSVTVKAGAEKYMCYAKTLDRELVIDRYTYDHADAVHHLLLATATAPEPEGLSECDVLFRTSWVPLFGAGNGEADLEAPPGSGQVLPKGTQLLIQLHLLNATNADVKTAATVKMREAEDPNVTPIGLYAFGTNDVTLAPNQTGGVTNDCTVEHDLDIFAWWPHMHRLGKTLSLEVGPDEAHLKEVYRLDPWDFDDQKMYAAPLHIPKGSLSRVKCEFDNTTSAEVTFGESSGNEMCFLPTFVTGAGTEVDGCVYLKPVMGEEVPPDPAAGTCEDKKPNDLGIGAACSKGGGECADGLSCTEDQGSDPPGFCIKLGGCKVTPDCGGGWATCCAPKEAGGLINICIPEACRPADCIPQK